MKLTPTQDLIMEVLAARYRCGEHLWTFDSRHTKAIRELSRLGLVHEASGVTEHSIRAMLTDAGKALYLLDTYIPPNAAAARLDEVRDLSNRADTYGPDEFGTFKAALKEALKP